MRIIKKRLSCLLLALLMLFSFAPRAAAVSEAELTSAIDRAAEYVYNAVKSPQVGSAGGEWAVLGLARSGYDVPQSYYEEYYRSVEAYVKACGGVLHEKKYSEYSRVILALTAIGADPENVAGYNLLTPLGDFEQTVWQGINGACWALIALDSGSYDMPVNSSAATQATRQMYIDKLLAESAAGGGWSLSGADAAAADPDVTGTVLQALAKYQDQSAVKEATEAALTWLSTVQDNSGGYSSWGAANSESVAQVVAALCELGISPEDSRFVKNGNTLLDSLLGYQLESGAFLHIDAGGQESQMATEQGLCGMAAALRYFRGQSSLYRMDDVSIRVSGGTAGTVGLAGKHADVKSVEVSVPGAAFEDIAGHKNEAAVKELASRGIINGMGGGRFAPDGTMTRAQFSALVVRALGLSPQAGDAFTDVPEGEWYAPYIGTAYSYGLINGRGGGIFDPEGTINRQEAAALVMRAAALCGMDTALSADEVRDRLAQFGDYITADSWAKEALAFCYGEDILNQADLDIRPAKPILRGEIAQMIYNMLASANLI